MMLRRAFQNMLLGLAALVALSSVSCSDDRTKILSEGKMEDVLFDYHLAEGISRVKRVDSLTAKGFYDEILRKHGITQAEFDSSMIFYMKNADKLHAIYERLADRMTNEARLQGMEGSSLASAFTSEGDTADIWAMDKERVFTAFVPDNMMKFSFKADTTFKEGDRFVLSFKTDFLYQDGTRNGLAAVSVRFANDSVVTRSRVLSSSSSSKLEIKDDKRIGVKEVSGYFMQRQPSGAADQRNSSTLRMMVVSDITLLKMHTKEPEGVLRTDSLKTEGAQADTARTESNEKIKKIDDNEKDNLVPVTLDSVRGSRQGVHKLHSRTRNQR